MNNEEIIEGNKIIALFMGGEINRDGDLIYFPLPQNKYCSTNSLQYHTSWQWLMPAWHKFRALDFRPHDGGEGVQPLHNNYCARIAHKLAYGEIKDVFRTLVNAIEWSNSQTQTA